MPLEKLEKRGFVYIAYRRDHIKDFDKFRGALKEALKADKNMHDIVVDLTRDIMLTEGEVALLAAIIKELQGTTRHLRIIANEAIDKKLASTNLLKIENIIVYINHEQLLKDLNNSINNDTPPPAEPSSAPQPALKTA
jgi:hypothetical protein